MNSLLTKLTTKHNKTNNIDINVNINDILVIERLSGEFKNNKTTFTGECVKIKKTKLGNLVTLHVKMYNEFIYTSFFTNSPLINKIKKV